MTLTGNDLISIGFKEGKAIGVALEIVEKQFDGLDSDAKLNAIKRSIRKSIDFSQ